MQIQTESDPEEGTIKSHWNKSHWNFIPRRVVWGIANKD